MVILHLSPDRDSQLAEILQTVSAIPVAQVTEKIHVERNRVYVVPPNRHLEMVDGFISVTENQTVAHHFDSFYARRRHQQTLCVIPDAADFPPNRRMFLQKLLSSGESYLWLSFHSHLSIERTWNLWMLPFFHDIYYFRLEKAARPFFYAEDQSFFDELIEFPDDVYRRLGSVY